MEDLIEKLPVTYNERIGENVISCEVGTKKLMRKAKDRVKVMLWIDPDDGELVFYTTVVYTDGSYDLRTNASKMKLMQKAVKSLNRAIDKADPDVLGELHYYMYV